MRYVQNSHIESETSFELKVRQALNKKKKKVMMKRLIRHSRLFNTLNVSQLETEIPIPDRSAESIEAKRKRLLWASRKRGILETDLLLSTFIHPRISKMTDVQLVEYDNLMYCNDWDIYYWLTGAKALPKDIASISFMDELLEHCKNKDKKILRMPELE